MSAPRPAALDAPGAPIYLDYNATTPVDPRVAAAMEPFLHGRFGNPNSGHAFGREARDAVAEARTETAALLGCAPDEILWTSGGSEANNHALKGAAWAQRDRGRHLVISAVEHPATSAPARWLATRGWRVDVVGVDKHGRLDLDALERALCDDTALVSVMHANNEVGTLQPVDEIAAIAHARGALVHTDAAQSAGKVPVRVDELGVDLASVAGHKLYGPKGVGALYVRRGTELENLVHGANQEGGRRAGTENVILAVGLGKAAALAAADLDEESPRLRALRDRLQDRLVREAGPVVVHGHPRERLPNTLSIAFPGLLAADLMAAVPEVACSAGSACHTGGVEISGVLKAMGVSAEAGAGTLRLSVGRFSREEEIDAAAERLTAAIATLR